MTTAVLLTALTAFIPPAINPSSDPEMPRLQLQFTANHSGAVLQRQIATGSFNRPLGIVPWATFDSWSTVCKAPCRRTLAPDGTYRVAGDDIVPSEILSLPDASAVELRASTGSQTQRTVGAVLSWIGLTAGVVGAGALAGQAAVNNGPDTNQLFLTIGIVSLAVGAGLAAIGLPIMLTSHTTVEILPAQASGPPQVEASR